MALVFLALNGIGLGHLTRTHVVGRELQRNGYRPIIISQGIYPEYLEEEIPGTTVPSVWKTPVSSRGPIAHWVSSMAAINRPSIVFEDTHPAPFQLASGLRRVLIVRPTIFEYLLELRESNREIDAFLLADHPESPMWPYSEEQTNEIRQWDNWLFLNPVFRTASPQDLYDIAVKYGLSNHERLYVFTPGGGGSQLPDYSDLHMFIDRAVSIAEQIRESEPNSRLIFVRGPFFPETLEVPSLFDQIAVEHNMQALLARAQGAVIRPGPNSILECISGETPSIIIPTVTYKEPVMQRIEKLRRCGLLYEKWKDFRSLEKRAQFERGCQEFRARWKGNPDLSSLRRVIDGELWSTNSTHAHSGVTPFTYSRANEWKSFAMRLCEATSKGRVSIRVDDVTGIDQEIILINQWIQRLELYASLEVVPYLCDFNEYDLDIIDPNRRLEISQHGFAHVPDRNIAGIRGEFFDSVEGNTKSLSIRQLSVGRAFLQERFPTRFTGGYSPPFDGLPDWLPTVWADIGGTYLSLIWASCQNNRIRIARAGMDPWNWKQNCFRSLPEIMDQIIRAWSENGECGIVLHPQLLRNVQTRQEFEHLLISVKAANIEPYRLSTHAAHRD